MSEAFPLSWPRRVKRTETIYRTRGRFGTRKRGGYLQELTVAEAVERLKAELDMLFDADGTWRQGVVISTNVELRRDGLPRSDRREPPDPGVAVYFWLARKSYCLPCDKFDRVADNMAAIAGHIAATRAIERYGVGTVEQAFTGFSYLPPPSWWTDLGFKVRPASIEEAEAAWRRVVKEHHPDRGGSVEITARANQAIAEARKELAQ